MGYGLQVTVQHAIFPAHGKAEDTQVACLGGAEVCEGEKILQQELPRCPGLNSITQI